MDSRTDRIPIPSAQRWENFRERVLPAICLAATLVACAALWRHEGRMAPFVHGEVEAEVIVIRSPADGQLLSLEGQSSGEWPLFASVDSGDVAARLQRTDPPGDVVEVPTPIQGLVTRIAAHPGEWIARGETILEVASVEPTHILCHVPDVAASLPSIGSEVAVRPRGAGNHWTTATIEGIGPIVASAAVFDASGVSVPVRGLPVRIAVPKDLPLKPGSPVDVRFPPSGSKS